MFLQSSFIKTQIYKLAVLKFIKIFKSNSKLFIFDIRKLKRDITCVAHDSIYYKSWQVFLLHPLFKHIGFNKAYNG